MPVSKKKRTTSTPDPSTSDTSSPVLPDEQVFHQYLRTLAQSAVRVVIETVMCEELDQFIGAAWGEGSPKRKGSRNGTSCAEESKEGWLSLLQDLRTRGATQMDLIVTELRFFQLGNLVVGKKGMMW